MFDEARRRQLCWQRFEARHCQTLLIGLPGDQVEADELAIVHDCSLRDAPDSGGHELLANL